MQLQVTRPSFLFCASVEVNIRHRRQNRIKNVWPSMTQSMLTHLLRTLMFIQCSD